MKGAHRVIVETKKIKYDFVVKKKYYDSDRRQWFWKNGVD